MDYNNSAILTKVGLKEDLVLENQSPSVFLPMLSKETVRISKNHFLMPLLNGAHDISDLPTVNENISKSPKNLPREANIIPEFIEPALPKHGI